MKKEDIFQYAFALLFILGFFIMSWLLHDSESQTAKDTVTTMRDGVILILGFLFGSSRGSFLKNRIKDPEQNQGGTSTGSVS